VDNDVEFGNIKPFTTVVSEALPSISIDKNTISHLSDVGKRQLLDLLDAFHNFSMCCSDKPGLCSVIHHGIVTLPGFLPKRIKSYRIPEALKPEVEKQIDDLVQVGNSIPSTSPMISPMVCVVENRGKIGSTQVRFFVIFDI
jgi:hypothetical protein